MAKDNSTGPALADDPALDIVAEADTGARTPRGAPEKILLGTALLWSLFQLWIASPVPFMVGTIDFGIVKIPTVFNDTQARSIHLAFAIFLAYIAFPALKRSPRDRIPVQDWVFAVLGALSAAYLYIFYESISDRPGAPIPQDIVVACIGMVLLLEATRRSLGPPLTIVATVFLIYNFAGPFMPAIIAHKGNSLNEVVNHQWITTEGVFGIALGVSTSFVFLFVLFGALLDKAGAGNYFIQLAFSLLGHLRGGPAKAAVVSSGMTGLISGSSIANVVTTGTFTIPLMKRVGFPAEKAGAIEVAASTNGQLTPPVMGAAAFLMVEYLGIPYIDVIKHAFLPAIISYIALVYIVHLEALKARMQGLPKPGEPKPLVRRLMGILLGFIVVCAAAVIVYLGLGWMPSVFGNATPWIAAAIVAAVYVALVRYAAQVPDLELEDPNSPVVELPETKRVLRTGLHFILPIIVLVYCLMVLRLSPGLSAFWATVLMMVILATQRPLLALFRGGGETMAAWRRGFGELIDGLIGGARNMIGIGIATATAGIIVGVVSQTGVGSALAEVVEVLSFGSVFVMLLWTAVLCVILGMGLPTTATYIVVVALLAPVIVTVGQQNGLIVPAVAVHLFVFYFGIIADDTPPVGLAAFAAAAISGGDPIRTGVQGFVYDIRTAVLPFMFIYNTDLLLIDVTWLQGIAIFITATIAMLVFAAATQGYFLARSRIYETLALLLIAFTMFRPGFWIDQIAAPYIDYDGKKVMEAIAQAKPGDKLRFIVLGEDDVGDPLRRVVIAEVGKGDTVKQRLDAMGLEIVEKDGRMIVDNAAFDSAAKKAGFDLDQEIVLVRLPTEQPSKELMYIPALLLLLLIGFLQRRRSRAEDSPGTTATAART